MNIKQLKDDNGVIAKANKILPNELYKKFIESLAELEDNDCHKTSSYPKTGLHKVEGIKENVYRAYIGKTSGWRLHVQYESTYIALNDILKGREHDSTTKLIKTRKHRYK